MRDGRLGAVVGAIISLMVSGCATGDSARNDLTTGSLTPADARHQDQAVEKGKLHYAKGSYGLAERSFRTAVEENPKDAEAWLGLAASYDRLRRFELADRAYRQVLSLQGRTVEVLNNLAYHHMLRGNIKQARLLLDEASRRDPNNPVVAGNFRLLESWKGRSTQVN
jgi:Flp pilus assembly protein TadD